MRNRTIFLCGILFIAWLAFPALTVPLTAPCNVEYIRNIEKHYPPTWPKLSSWRDLLHTGTYDQITRVLQSRILPRRLLIGAKKNLEFHLLREPRLAGVDRGSDGWLFLRETYDRSWESPERARHALDLCDAFLTRGTRPRTALRLMIAPSKYTIYPELMSKTSAALAKRYAWYHRTLASRWSRPGTPEQIELWSAYRQARTETSDLLFFPKDTHHTPLGAMVMLRTLTKSLDPGLWREEDVRTGEEFGWEGDLAGYAGVVLPQDRYRRRSIVRPGLTLLGHDRPAPPEDEWGPVERFRFTSRDRPLWPGRTLIAHDSMLKEYRTDLAQFFADVTFLHYKDLIGDGRFLSTFETYDTVILEIGERYAVDILERLFQPLAPVRPAARISPAELGLPSDRVRVLEQNEARLVLETLVPEVVLRLPARDLDPRRSYLLELNVHAAQGTWCRLYLHRFTPGGGSVLQVEDKVLWRGPNRAYFYLTHETLGYPPELVLSQPNRYQLGPFSLIPLEEVDRPADPAPVRVWTTTWRSRVQAPAIPAEVCGNSETELHPAPGRLWIESRGADPQVFLSGLPAGAGSRLDVELVLWSSRETLLQLFYQSPDEPGYSEARSLSRSLVPGENRLTFRLPATAARRPMRLDPACHPGWYGITGLTFGPTRTHSGDRDDRVSLTLPAAASRPVPSTWLAEALGNSQVRLDLQGDRLQCLALGDDPSLLLPSLERSEPGPLRLKFRIEAPTETLGQVFFQTAPGQVFRENNSRRFSLHVGPNSVSVDLPSAAGLYPLRLDPGCHPGVYTVQEFAVSGADTDAP